MTTETKNEIAKVSVPRQNIAGLKKQLDKLIKKASKLNSATVGYEISPEFVKKTYQNQDGENIEVVCQTVFVFGDAPIIKGWTFSASLSHFPDVGNVIRAVPGETVPEKYQKTDTTLCEHCFTNRFRKEVYVVRNVDSGEYKQVGSTCLKDFIGHGDPKAIAKYAETLITLKETVESFDDFETFKNSVQSYANLERFLTYVAKSIREEGWTSRGQAYDQMTVSTAELAWNEMTGSGKSEDGYPTKADEEMAEAAIEWGQGFEGSEKEFEHNLYVISSFGSITRKEFGFAAYLVQGYIRSVEKAKYLAKKEKIVALDAEVKSRFEVVAKVAMIKTVDGFYGTSRLVKFDVEQEDGTIVQLVTFGTGKDVYELEEEKTYLIRVTVKGHEEYNGTPQTKVNRVKIIKTFE